MEEEKAVKHDFECKEPGCSRIITMHVFPDRPDSMENFCPDTKCGKKYKFTFDSEGEMKNWTKVS